MALLRLPPEILKKIFDDTGPPFFHQDLRRLTVCKHWFQLALPTCLGSVTLNPVSLAILASSQEMDSQKHFSVTHYLQCLDLELAGSPSQDTAVRRDGNQDSRPASTIENWAQKLDRDLVRLAGLVQKSQKLHTLRIRASHSPSTDPSGDVHDYLSLRTMQSLLLLESLRVLVLDLSVPLTSLQEEHQHVCPAIAALLHTLTTLHVRMRSICPTILQPPRDTENKLYLREVVINLSLVEDLPGRTSAAHSTRCCSLGGDLPQLKLDLVHHAEALASRLSSPRTLRILTHSLPQFETQSLDVLTGISSILDEGMQWNEDGRPVEEYTESESDFSDSDFPSEADE